MTELQIGDKWKITSDSSCYSLLEYRQGSNKGVHSGKWSWKDSSCYYSNLESMIRELANKNLKTADVKNLGDIMNVLDQFKSDLNVFLEKHFGNT